MCVCVLVYLKTHYINCYIIVDGNIFMSEIEKFSYFFCLRYLFFVVCFVCLYLFLFCLFLFLLCLLFYLSYFLVVVSGRTH